MIDVYKRQLLKKLADGREIVGLNAYELSLIHILLKRNPMPNKATHQREWVQHMNSLKAQAEEIVLAEIIYN